MRNNSIFLRLFLPLLWLFVAVPSLWAYEPYGNDGYYYDKYHVQMVVHSDNSYTIVEQIDIVFTQPRHGIYRSLVTDSWIQRDISEAQDGSETAMRHYDVKYSDIDVSVPFKVFDENGIKDIRIGSSTYNYEGPTHFNIFYNMKVPTDRVKQSDLLFHSLMGVGEPCTTEEFSFSIRFEKPVPEASLQRLQIFSGDLGNNDDKAAQVITTCTPTLIEGRIAELYPYQAVTLYMPLPEGYFPISTPWQAYVAWVFIALAVVLLLYVLYKEFTTDDKVTPVVSFNPPKGMTSAEVGTLIDCSVDDRDMISLIPWLANEGYLRIEKCDGNPLLVKQEKDTAELPSYVKSFYEALFVDGDTFSPDKPTSRKFGSKWLTARGRIDKQMNNKLNVSDSKTFSILTLGILFAAIGLAWASCVSHAWGFGLLFFVALMFTSLIIWMGFSTSTSYGVLVIAIPIALLPEFLLSGILPEGFTVFLQEIIAGVTESNYYLPFYGDASADVYVPQFVFNGLILLAMVVACLSFRLFYLSPYRRQHLGVLMGLQDFIRTAQQDRLKMLLDQDEQYFYRILPYAVAFGLAKEWTERFAGMTIVRNPNISEQFPVTELYNIHGHFMTSNFTHGIKAEEEARAAAAARERARSGSSHSSSRSFGGGGGGYSGGGFGGGGSRSW